MFIPLVDIWACRVCTLYIVCVYTHTHTHTLSSIQFIYSFIYLFIYNAKNNNRFTFLVFGMVHSDKTLVVLLLNTLVLVLLLAVILSSLSHIICMLIWVTLTLWHISTIFLPFSGWFIMFHLSSILIAFDQFFTWIALGDVHLHLSLILVTKANAVEE